MTPLKTHYLNHQSLKEEFYFTGMVEVSAVGQSGGITILWNTEEVTLDPIATIQQEIHCKIQVNPLHFTWLLSIIYASTVAHNKEIIWNNIRCLYDNYKGPG